MAKVVGLSFVREVPIHVYNTEIDDYEAQIIKVRKLPLGEAAKLGQVLDSIPEQLKALQENAQIQELLGGANLEEMDASAFGAVIVELLPTLLNVATELIMEILAIGSKADRELLGQIGIDEATEILVAIFEVNNLQATWGNVQKLRQMFSMFSQPQANEEPKKKNG